MKRVYLLVACCLLITSLAFSQTQQAPPQQIRARGKLIHAAPTTCPNDPVLVSDGTEAIDDIVFASTSAFYALNVKAGHSYSIEVYDHTDVTTTFSPIIKVTSDCSTSIDGVVDVANVDPDISGGFSDRVSWIQGSSDQRVYIDVMNPDPNADYNYNIRVTDTTLFSPRWSTYSGFDTQWGFTNTTTSSITGTLTIYDATGPVLATITKTFAPGLFTLVTAIGSGVPVKHSGGAVFAYVGPAGALVTDEYNINGNNTVIVPFIFESKHAYH
jgi:hypothetical protein